MTTDNMKTDGGPAVAPSRLSQIRNDLQQELDCAEGNLARLKEQLSAAERDHKAIKDAVAALSKRGGSSTRKPTVKQAAMMQAVLQHLQGRASPLPVDKLDALLREEFTRQGFSLTGMSLRLKEVLAADEIVVASTGVSLREAG